MYYVIALDQGDYFEMRGAFDWGRTNKYHATTFASRAAAEAEIRQCKLESFGARVEEMVD